MNQTVAGGFESHLFTGDAHSACRGPSSRGSIKRQNGNSSEASRRYLIIVILR